MQQDKLPSGGRLTYVSIEVACQSNGNDSVCVCSISLFVQSFMIFYIFVCTYVLFWLFYLSAQPLPLLTDVTMALFSSVLPSNLVSPGNHAVKFATSEHKVIHFLSFIYGLDSWWWSAIVTTPNRDFFCHVLVMFYWYSEVIWLPAKYSVGPTTCVRPTHKRNKWIFVMDIGWWRICLHSFTFMDWVPYKKMWF